MQFLWQLLPGARETRNQIIVGYVWLLAAALWIGVPDPSAGSELGDLVDAVGPVGVGIALGFGAFLLGSLSDDVVSRLIGSRGAAAFSLERPDVRLEFGILGLTASFPVRVPERTRPAPTRGADALDMIRAMPESVRAELERLEAAIDRSSAEVSLRAGLVLPTALACAAGVQDAWYWGILGAIAVLALIWQGSSRRAELRLNLQASGEIRDGIAAEIRGEERSAVERAS